MMDHLSEGRFEFGTGRGSSTTEMFGFGVEKAEDTVSMWDESIREFPKMWRETSYWHDGEWFSTPRGAPRRARGPQRAAQAVHAAAPADVGRGGEPVDVREGRPPRPRRDLLQLRRPPATPPRDRDVQGDHPGPARAGRRVRQQQRHGGHERVRARGPRRGDRARLRDRDELLPLPRGPLARQLPAVRRDSRSGPRCCPSRNRRCSSR